MHLSSMTGFARASGNNAGLAWLWELRSVNSKSLDVRLRFPPGFEHLENGAREAIGKALRRGNIQASLTLDAATADTNLVINEAVLARVVERARELRKQLRGPPLQAEALLAMRGVMEASQDVISDEHKPRLNVAILKSLAQAVESLSAMRLAEGKRLATVLESQLNSVQNLSSAIRSNPARSPEAVRERLREQVQKLLDVSSTFDQDRLHQEAILLATKNDVLEELDRLDSHVIAARDLLQVHEPVGRKFDFLTQEFNREANTICSKSNDRTITVSGLELKTIIDQMREQVQNIE